MNFWQVTSRSFSYPVHAIANRAADVRKQFADAKAVRVTPAELPRFWCVAGDSSDRYVLAFDAADAAIQLGGSVAYRTLIDRVEPMDRYTIELGLFGVELRHLGELTKVWPWSTPWATIEKTIYRHTHRRNATRPAIVVPAGSLNYLETRIAASVVLQAS